MRFYSYQGTDSQGRPTQGTLQASSAEEAGRLLLGGGVRASGIRELGAATATSRPVAPPKPRPAPTPTPVPVASTHQPMTWVPRDAGDKASFFLFEQLGRLLRSGIGANRALDELGRQCRKPWLGERLRWASMAVAEGMSLADALEGCACFPTGVVGTIRAGEASGAVPDACVQAARGCEQAHRLGTRCAIMTTVAILIALYVPLGIALTRGSVDSMEAQADANGMLPVWSTFLGRVWTHLLGILPFALAWWAALLVGWRLWLTPRFREVRHRAVLGAPFLGGRAREESLARVSWALTELARAGLSPARAMGFAADASPNLVLAARFREQARLMGESGRLSTALRATGLLDPQMIDVVENGELAGDVPGAVASVHRATGMEFERKDATAATKIWYVVLPVLGVVVLAIIYHMFKAIVGGEIHAMLKDT